MMESACACGAFYSMKLKNINSLKNFPDFNGRFGDYGGRFVAETLMPLILQVEDS